MPTPQVVTTSYTTYTNACKVLGFKPLSYAWWANRVINEWKA